MSFDARESGLTCSASDAAVIQGGRLSVATFLANAAGKKFGCIQTQHDKVKVLSNAKNPHCRQAAG